jgi:hypothetical protein
MDDAITTAVYGSLPDLPPHFKSNVGAINAALDACPEMQCAASNIDEKTASSQCAGKRTKSPISATIQWRGL